MSETILETIGVTDKDVNNWLSRGLKITYPMKRNKNYYKSEDGHVFIENADKYVPKLSKKEINMYKKNPYQFKKDFLKNVRLYSQFINWLREKQKETLQIESVDKKFAALLSLLYLFQNGMDHHYYHFDRYLVYQNYPDTPVGYWTAKVKRASEKIAKKTESDKNTVLLGLLSDDKDLLELGEDVLGDEKYDELILALKNIKIFEDAQQDEIELLIDFKTNENLLFRTAIPIWDELLNLLKKNDKLVKIKYRDKIKEIVSGHPIIMTRKILVPSGLKYFEDGLVDEFEKEIKRWIK